MKKKYYNVSDLTDVFTNSDEERSSDIDSNKEGEITLPPPVDRRNAETDCYSNSSDDENEGLCLIVCCELHVLQI